MRGDELLPLGQNVGWQLAKETQSLPNDDPAFQQKAD
jgi:hypothetical protein